MEPVTSTLTVVCSLKETLKVFTLKPGGFTTRTGALYHHQYFGNKKIQSSPLKEHSTYNLSPSNLTQAD